MAKGFKDFLKDQAAARSRTGDQWFRYLEGLHPEEVPIHSETQTRMIETHISYKVAQTLIDRLMVNGYKLTYDLHERNANFYYFMKYNISINLSISKTSSGAENPREDVYMTCEFE